MVKPVADPDHAARRTHVIGALADAVSTLHRPRPVRVAVDALSGAVAPDLADELARTVIARGRHCGRASLDAFGYLYRHGPALTLDFAGRHADELLVVDCSFLQHPEFIGAWDLVIFARGRHGRHAHAWLVLADARRLPLPTGSIDAAFVAGLLPHLPEPTHAVTQEE